MEEESFGELVSTKMLVDLGMGVAVNPAAVVLVQGDTESCTIYLSNGHHFQTGLSHDEVMDLVNG